MILKELYPIFQDYEMIKYVIYLNDDCDEVITNATTFGSHESLKVYNKYKDCKVCGITTDFCLKDPTGKFTTSNIYTYLKVYVVGYDEVKKS